MRSRHIRYEVEVDCDIDGYVERFAIDWPLEIGLIVVPGFLLIKKSILLWRKIKRGSK
jgi:hypothetical protein